MENNDPPVGDVKTVFRMSREDYLKLERELSPPNVDDKTTELNAGMKLGIQVVLAKFRRDFVQGL
jgi:hypothetical protein